MAFRRLLLVRSMTSSRVTPGLSRVPAASAWGRCGMREKGSAKAQKFVAQLLSAWRRSTPGNCGNSSNKE
jgi:hypothetical protein